MLICIGVTSKTLDCINWKLMWVCWTPWRVKCIVADVLSVSPLFFHSDEGLTLETPVNKNKIMLLHKLSVDTVQRFRPWQDLLRTRPTQDKSYSGQDLPRTRPTQDKTYSGQDLLRSRPTQDKTYPRQELLRTRPTQDKTYSSQDLLTRWTLPPSPSCEPLQLSLWILPPSVKS